MSYRMGAVLALTLAAATTSASVSAATPDEVVATFLDDQVTAVCRIKLDRVKVDEFLGGLGEAPLSENRLGPWVEALRKAGARELYLIATLDDLPPGPTPAPAALVPIGDGADAQAIGALLCGGPSTGGPRAWTTCASIRGAVLAGDDAVLERARSLKPVDRPDLTAGLGSAGDAAVVAVAAPPRGLRRAVDEMTPRLPEELGGGSTSVLTRGLEWVAVSVEPTPSPMVRIVGQASDAAAAEALKTLGERAVQLIGSSSRIADFVPQIKLLADELRPRVEGRRVVIDLSGRAGVQWARAVIEPVAETSLRARCVDNLKLLGLAMHNYESTHGTLPPAYSVDANGKPLLSWRVAILPFVDQGDLFKEFHQDEPWDSPHNKTLIERMPQVFACPSRRGGALAPGTTIYKTPRETYTLFPGKVGVAIKEITDGTSTTIMILETADQAVVWTRPDDWDVPATIDPKVLLTRHLGGASATLGDGSVLFFRRTMNPATLLKLLTRAGGEVVDPGDD